MTKSTITRECIEQYANDPRMCNINDEIREMARIALAAMQQDPVAWRYRYHNGLAPSIWKYADCESECNSAPNYQRQPLYTAPQPAPVVPDGWISCSERMPGKGERVLVFVDFDSSAVTPLAKDAEYTGSTFRIGPNTVNTTGEPRVTHWMPLPAQPQQDVK